MVLFAGLGDGLGPFGMVDGIGIELGLQADAAALGVDHAVLAGGVHDVVAGIELDTGAVGIDVHDTAGNGIGQGGAGVAVDFPVVVEATLEVQCIIVFVDVTADGY